MFIIGYSITYFGFRYITSLPNVSNDLMELFFTYNSFNVLLMIIAIFIMCKKVKIKYPTLNAIISNLSVCGFGIYMVHYLFTGPMIYIVRMIDLPVSIQIPTAAIIAFIISWALVYVIYMSLGKKSKYIIG